MIKKYLFLTIIFSLLFSFTVQASETVSGSDDSERLNAMEQRLADIGTSVEDIRTRLLSAEEQLAADEQFRLSVAEQLDILLVGINAWYNDFNSYIETDVLYKQEMLDKYTELLENVTLLDKKLFTTNDSLTKLIRLTVSGNTISSDTNDILTDKLGLSNEEMLSELNETLLT